MFKRKFVQDYPTQDLVVSRWVGILFFLKLNFNKQENGITITET